MGRGFVSRLKTFSPHMMHNTGESVQEMAYSNSILHLLILIVAGFLPGDFARMLTPSGRVVEDDAARPV